MPGPLPTGNARRRNAPTLPTDALDVDGRTSDVPEPLFDLSTPERRFYEWAWSTPAACAWHWSDAELVADWARLKSLASRYMAGEILKFGKDGEAFPAELPSALLSQITAREDRLYLSPSARKKGRTAIVPTAEPTSATTTGNVTTPDRWKRTAS